MDKYTFEEHTHNYAVWTAARAVSRNFTTTKNVKTAIEASDLRSFANENKAITQEEFDKKHIQWAGCLIKSLSYSTGKPVSYGRAAKIISIYLKTSVILCNKGECAISMLIHPPIDARLLKKIAEQPGLEDLKNIRWTQLKEEAYWNLANRLTSEFGSFDWRLEYFWKPEQGE